MKHHILSALLAAFLLSAMLTGCAPDGNTPSESGTAPIASADKAFSLDPNGVASYNIQVPVPARDAEIPAILTLPKGSAKEQVPLVVMYHGHGGSKSENGGFDDIALALAERGIASIRMDFAGCGDSTESFQDNNLFSMTQDANNSLLYAVENAPIDTDRIGAFGYSMGGRLVIDGAALDDVSYKPFRAISLLAPSADPGEEMMVRYFGSRESYESHKAEAFSQQKYTTYINGFGQEQELSIYWFDDLLLSNPTKSITNYNGKVQVLYGTKDTVVPGEVVEAFIAAVPNAPQVVKLEGADHGYGFYDDNAAVRRQVAEAVAAYFAEVL